MTRHRLLLLTTILVAFALRVWHLPTIPAGLWYDEAYNAMDARWMVDSGQYLLFFVGNNGREPLWLYLVAFSTSLLGNTPFAIRWVGALAGIITIPIMYRFAALFLRPYAQQAIDRQWLALIAAGWVAVSWWHLLNSRAGFRPILLPPLLMLSLYFFWRGVKVSGIRCQVSGGQYPASRLTSHEAANTLSTFHFPLSTAIPFLLSGLCLGLSQYTYLPARLLPLLFAGLALLWTIHLVRTRRNTSQFTIDNSLFTILFLPLLLTALTALLTFLPLGLYFLNNPDTFSSRTGDVLFIPQTLSELTSHAGQAISLFLGAGHELYRHHLPGRAMLGWLEIPFFWLGLIFLLRPKILRQPETQVLLLGFGLMWLPTLLASPPVHALRPIGLLPFYYLIVTYGLYQAVQLRQWVLYAKRSPTQNTPQAKRNTQYALLLTPLIFTGIINTYDYFQNWAPHPEVYQEYNGPLVDLTAHIRTLSQTHDVIVPFHIYAHPTFRFLLQNEFPEMSGQLPELKRPLDILLTPDPFQLLYVGNIPQSPAMVLLTRDSSGTSAAYVSRPPRAEEQQALNNLLSSLEPHPFLDALNRPVAQFVPNLPISQSPNLQSLISNLFTPTPLRTIDLNWNNQAHLLGYDVSPASPQPGQPLTLNLYWQSLTDRAFEPELFIQLIDSNDQPFNQWEQPAFREDMYRWRPNGLLVTQHILPLPPEMPDGPYLLRLGFFDPTTGERLPLVTNDPASTPLDQVQLGLFYISPDDTLLQPTLPLNITFANSIQLTGISIPDINNSQLTIHNSQLSVKFFWHTLHPTPTPQTIFLQLLTAQGEVVSGWDSQPFNGLYPTSLWSPGETLHDTFHLPLPETGLPPGHYRLISGFYDFSAGQRLLVDDGGDFAVLTEFEVE